MNKKKIADTRLAGFMPEKNIIDTNSKLPDYSGQLENLMIEKILSTELDLEEIVEVDVEKITNIIDQLCANSAVSDMLYTECQMIANEIAKQFPVKWKPLKGEMPCI